MTVKNVRNIFSYKFIAIGMGVLFIVYVGLAFLSYFINAPNNFKSGTYIGPVSVGGQDLSTAQKSIQKYIDESKVSIQYSTDIITATASTLGVYVSDESITQLQNNQRQRGLYLPFVYTKSLELPIEFNEQKFALTTQAALKDKTVAVATPAYYSYTDKTLTIVPGTEGLGIAGSSLQNKLESEIASGNQDIILSSELSTQPPVTQSAQLELLKYLAQDIINKEYTINADEIVFPINTTRLAPVLTPTSDYTSLTISESDSMALINEIATKATIAPVNEVVSAYVSGKAKQITQKGVSGKTPINTEQLAKDLKSAIDANTPFNSKITWEEVPYVTENITVNDVKVYRYKISSWGTIQSSIEEFRNKVAETLASPKGWVQSDISFQEVTSGEQFEIVLSEASELPARYPNTCDATYSCRVGKYVIINDDRWRLATLPWTGTIRDYQHMVINHETGHWLGQKHIFCTAAGQLAPVMQQQSINLNGCVFNPWPLIYEINAVRATNR